MIPAFMRGGIMWIEGLGGRHTCSAPTQADLGAQKDPRGYEFSALFCVWGN